MLPTRRIAAAGLLSMLIARLRPPAALAFDNGVPELQNFLNQTRYPGTQPTLGLQSNGKLKTCDYEPNCFSTSGDEYHLLKPWRPKAGGDAMSELLETIKAYPPGQANIDKGGWSIITASDNYLYVQFESLKLGFIDDVEMAVNKDGSEVQVRSSSRIGFLDLGVNAKRLNWISKDLQKKGWTAPPVSKAEYEEYWDQLDRRAFTNDDYIRSVLSPETCPSPADVEGCK